MKSKTREKSPEELIKAAKRVLHGYPEESMELKKIKTFIRQQLSRIKK